MEIVYETLSVPNRAAELTAKRRRVAILWIDDSLLGRQWLSAVTGLLTELSPPRDDVRLRILGPSDSEGLVAALNELTNLDERLRAPDKRVAPDPRNNVPPPANSVEAEGLAELEHAGPAERHQRQLDGARRAVAEGGQTVGPAPRAARGVSVGRPARRSGDRRGLSRTPSRGA